MGIGLKFSRFGALFCGELWGAALQSVAFSNNFGGSFWGFALQNNFGELFKEYKYEES